MDWNFDGIKEFLRSKLSAKVGFQNTLFYGNNERLLDAVAYLIEKKAKRNEYLLSEAKWGLMRNKTSALRQCSFLGYKPYRKQSAETYVKIGTSPTFESKWTGNTLTIPKWSQLIFGDKPVYLTEEINYANATFMLVNVAQGVPIEYLYTPSGVLNESFTIEDNSVDSQYIEVFAKVSEISNEYVKVPVLKSFDEAVDFDTLYCTIIDNIDFTKVTIKFTDNLYSRKVRFNEKIKVIYGRTAGKDGNQYKLDTVTPTFIVNDLGIPVTFYAEAISFLDGGTDCENLASIKINAPREHWAVSRVGSGNDWVTILGKHPDIGKVNVYGEEDLINDILAQMDLSEAVALGLLTEAGRIEAYQNVIAITAMTSSGYVLSNVQKLDIVNNYLRKEHGLSISDFVTWKDPETIKLRVIGSIVLDKTKEESVVDLNVKELLYETYKLEVMNFFDPVNNSDFNSKIQNIEGVYKHNSDIYVRDLRYPRMATEQISVNAGKIAPSSLFMRIARKQKGMWVYDDVVAESILNEDGYTGVLVPKKQYFNLVSSHIDYETGVIQYTPKGDCLPHLNNQDFSSGFEYWEVNTSTVPVSLFYNFVDSDVELGKSSSSIRDLWKDRSLNPYCLRLQRNSTVSAEQVVAQWIKQSIINTPVGQCELECLVFMPNNQSEGRGHACRVMIENTGVGNNVNVDYMFSTRAMHELRRAVPLTVTTLLTLLHKTSYTNLILFSITTEVNLTPVNVQLNFTSVTATYVSVIELINLINIELFVLGVNAECSISPQGSFCFYSKNNTSAGRVTVTDIQVGGSVTNPIMFFGTILGTTLGVPQVKTGDLGKWQSVRVPFIAGSGTMIVKLFFNSSYNTDTIYYDCVEVISVDTRPTTATAISNKWGKQADESLSINVNDNSTLIGVNEAYLIELFFKTESSGDIQPTKRNQVLALNKNDIIFSYSTKRAR